MNEEKKQKGNRKIRGILVIIAAAALVCYVVWGVFFRDAERTETETEEITEDWDDLLSGSMTEDETSADGETSNLILDPETTEQETELDESTLETQEYVAPEVTNGDFGINGLDEDIATLIDVEDLKTAIQEQLYREGFSDFSYAAVTDTELTDNSIVISMKVRCNRLVDIDMTTYFDGEWYLQVWSIED